LVKLAEVYDILGLGDRLHQAESAISPSTTRGWSSTSRSTRRKLFPMVAAGAALQETIDPPQFEEEKVVTTA
jgi:hypothetical protein